MAATKTLLSVLIIIVTCFPWQLESLYCHRCLALNCPDSPTDSQLCDKARNFIVSQLRPYYYIGAYLEPCPDPESGVEWRGLEITNDAQCEEDGRGLATCTLGRLELRISNNVTDNPADDNLIIHGTVLGCGKTELLKEMKAAKIGSNCSYIERIKRRSKNDADPYNYELEVEHCPNLSDYCTVDYCVSADVSVVRPFRPSADTSFEYGTVIAIIAIVVILFLVVIGASMCRNPLSHATNYSPAQVQEDQRAAVESSEQGEGSRSTATSVRSINASI